MRFLGTIFIHFDPVGTQCALLSSLHPITNSSHRHFSCRLFSLLPAVNAARGKATPCCTKSRFQTRGVLRVSALDALLCRERAPVLKTLD